MVIQWMFYILKMKIKMSIIPINPVNTNRADTNSFTNDQRIAYDKLIDFIDSPFDEKDYKRAAE